MDTSAVLKVPFVDLAAQRASIASEIDGAIADVLQRGDFILGQDVRQFEAEFSAFCEADHAIGVDSGTSALELALEAFEIGPGDEVITVANTFIATVLAISHVGAKPVLVDIDPDLYMLNLDQLTAAITPRTRAIIPVHLYGHPVGMDPIRALADQHNLIIIEDACQAHGARYRGQRTGTLGHAAAFSFYPAKNLGAYGDGGMVVTNDAQIAERVRMLRNYGQTQKYYHATIGYNHRLDTVQAAVLRVKLPHLDDWNTARRRHAAHYAELLDDLPVIVPQTAAYAEPVWHLYVIRVADRDRVRDALAQRGISTGIHYPIPIHVQPAYQPLGYHAGDFPVTERLADEIISLPMFAELTLNQIEHVAAVLSECVTQEPVSGP